MMASTAQVPTPRPAQPGPRQIVVGVSGASGALYALTLLRQLRALGPARVQTHLCISAAGARTVQAELGLPVAALYALADHCYAADDVGASIASGSFGADAMVVAPCSMHTLARIACALSDNLIARAADVMLKERRTLVLMVRESPLHAIHLRHMLTLSELGAVIAPPVPAFYLQPRSVDELVAHSVGRLLTLLGLPSPDQPRWSGQPSATDSISGATAQTDSPHASGPGAGSPCT